MNNIEIVNEFKKVINALKIEVKHLLGNLEFLHDALIHGSDINGALKVQIDKLTKIKNIIDQF